MTDSPSHLCSKGEAGPQQSLPLQFSRSHTGRGSRRRSSTRCGPAGCGPAPASCAVLRSGPCAASCASPVSPLPWQTPGRQGGGGRGGVGMVVWC